MDTHQSDTRPDESSLVIFDVRSNGSASQLPDFLFQIRRELSARIQAMNGTWKETRVMVALPGSIDKDELKHRLLTMVEVREVKWRNGKDTSVDSYPVVAVILNPESKVGRFIADGLASNNADGLLIDNLRIANNSRHEVSLFSGYDWLDGNIF